MSDPSRRRFIQGLATTCLGVTIAPRAFAANTPAGGKADSVIYLFMRGGMSHLDTFDLKPGKTAIQGNVTPLKTSATGIRVTDKLPLLARQMDQIAQVRNLFHTQGNHAPGQYIQYTGYPAEGGVVAHPALGSWVDKLSTARNANLPKYIRVGSLANHPLSGFFESIHNPLPVSDPSEGLQNSTLPEGVSDERFQKRFQLAGKLDSRFRSKYDSKDVRAYTGLYDDAVRMMRSEDLDAFDLSKETAETRERYGLTSFGQGCLLAKRLTARGVRFVEVDLDGWDSHVDNHKQVAEQCASMDRPIAALLADLKASGQLDRTLVVVSTEFGRSPFIDANAGRNHHPFGYTCLLAGAGAIGGAIHGETDETGNRPKDSHVTPADFNTTIAWALGIDYKKYESPAPGGQKFSVSGKDTTLPAKPITSLFS